MSPLTAVSTPGCWAVNMFTCFLFVCLFLLWLLLMTMIPFSSLPVHVLSVLLKFHFTPFLLLKCLQITQYSGQAPSIRTIKGGIVPGPATDESHFHRF